MLLLLFQIGCGSVLCIFVIDYPFSLASSFDETVRRFLDLRNGSTVQHKIDVANLLLDEL